MYMKWHWKMVSCHNKFKNVFMKSCKYTYIHINMLVRYGCFPMIGYFDANLFVLITFRVILHGCTECESILGFCFFDKNKSLFFFDKIVYVTHIPLLYIKICMRERKSFRSRGKGGIAEERKWEVTYGCLKNKYLSMYKNQNTAMSICRAAQINYLTAMWAYPRCWTS